MINDYTFLKCDYWTRWDEFQTDQQQGKAKPDVEKPYPADAQLIDLMNAKDFSIGERPVREVLAQRRSHRWFTPDPLSIEELSFLLWATQGIREISPDGERYYRNVPSGGNRHPFETYLSIQNVIGLEPGLYRYLPIEHKLLPLKNNPQLSRQVSEAGLDQTSIKDGKPYHFIENSAVVFIWTATPYRSEWRYGPAAPKLVGVDAGHVCQNLYIAAGAIGAGTVAVGAFDREAMDLVLEIDGEEEFSIYLAPVGKI